MWDLEKYEDPPKNFKMIEPEDAKTLLNDNIKASLIDTRPQYTWDKGHDKDAYHLTYDSFNEFIIKFKLEDPMIIMFKGHKPITSD